MMVRKIFSHDLHQFFPFPYSFPWLLQKIGQFSAYAAGCPWDLHVYTLRCVLSWPFLYYLMLMQFKNEHSSIGGREETNIWLQSKWCSAGMQKRNWWWLWKGIWLLSCLLPSNLCFHRILCNVHRLFYICSVNTTDLIWIVWTRIALSAVLCWAWRPPWHYFFIFHLLRDLLVYQKNVKHLRYFIPHGG